MPVGDQPEQYPFGLGYVRKDTLPFEVLGLVPEFMQIAAVVFPDDIFDPVAGTGVIAEHLRGEWRHLAQLSHPASKSGMTQTQAIDSYLVVT